MWNELGISGGTAIVILIALYFVIKWAVKMASKKPTVQSLERKLLKISKTKKSQKELLIQKINNSFVESTERKHYMFYIYIIFDFAMAVIMLFYLNMVL